MLSVLNHGACLLDSHLRVTFDEPSWLSGTIKDSASCKVSHSGCHAALHLANIDAC